MSMKYSSPTSSSSRVSTALKAAGCEVLFEPTLSGDALVAAIRESQAPVLVVRSTQVTDAMLDAGALSLIVRAGAGVNTIDVAGASERGIYVSNCPGKNAVAVAELTMGLILAIDRRIPDNVADLRAGKWNKKEYSKAKGLMGQTLGLLGFGTSARRWRGAPARSACRCWCGAAASARTTSARDAGGREFRHRDRAVRRRPGRAGGCHQRAPGADERHARFRRTRALLSHARPGAMLHQHRARRSGRSRRRWPRR